MEDFILRNLHFYLLFLLPLLCESQEAECYNYRRPNAFPSDAFIKEGDILIGGIYSVRDQSKDQTNPCGGQVTNWRWQQNIQAIVYSIDKINADPTILPNVTLGFVIIDDCRNAVTALGQALSFTQGSRTSSEPGMCSGRPTSGYDVAVVLGPTSSSRSVSSNQLLSLYRIPQISPEATSDDLTDHFDHAFFMRMVPPDKNQGAAIVDLISRYNWTYISLLYSEGSYGSNLAKQVQNRARENGICIGYITAFEANDKTVDEDRMDRTVDKLLLNRKSARIAVLIMGVDHLKMLFQSLVNKQAVGQLIFIGGDTLDQRAFVEYPYAAIGAMSLAVPLNLDRDFKQYFGDLNPDKTGGNPWFFPIWESIFGCSWTSSSNCPEFDRISQFEDFFVSDWTSKTLDAVSVVALGLHRLIKETCPNAVGHRMKIRQCAEGTKLLQYLREVNFEGITGQISFDENGDLIGSYLIRQWVLENDEQVVKNIATWQKDALIEGTGNLTFLQEPKFYNAKTLGARVEESDVIPESVCSKPCQVGYIYVQKELPCCWDCLPCRDNEYVTDNGTSCHQCPLLTWPEEGDREVCELIEPTYLAITDPFGMTLALLAIFGLILTIMWTCILVRHSHRKVIKASSVPITSVIAVGFYVSFISAFIFEWKPSVASCSIGHVGFHLSCTLLYGPLSVKTVRIYRIFAASKKCRRPRHLVSLNSQMITIGFLLLVQVLLVIATFLVANWEKYSKDGSLLVLLAPSSPRLEMPVVIQKYTELYCERHQIALYPPLAFNLLLLVICDVTAFLTRRLPEAFNESWFIFLSVSSTLVIWMAFLPTYFIIFFAFFKESLLSLALLLNAFCNMVFTCAPKIYAVWWVEDDDIAATYDINDTMEKDKRRMTKKMNESSSDLSVASKATAISGNNNHNN